MNNDIKRVKKANVQCKRKKKDWDLKYQSKNKKKIIK